MLGTKFLHNGCQILDRPNGYQHSWPASNRVQFFFPLVLYYRIFHNEYVLTLKIIKWSKNMMPLAALQTASVMKGWIWRENGERSVQNLTLSPHLLTKCWSMLYWSICFSFSFWVTAFSQFLVNIATFIAILPDVSDFASFAASWVHCHFDMALPLGHPYVSH